MYRKNVFTLAKTTLLDRSKVRERFLKRDLGNYLQKKAKFYI